MNCRLLYRTAALCASLMLGFAVSPVNAQDTSRSRLLTDWRAGLTGSQGFITAPIDELVTRTFSLDIDGDGVVDSVYLDRRNGKVVICFGGESVDCRGYVADLLDLLPTLDAATSRDSLLILNNNDSSAHCFASPDRSALDCISDKQNALKRDTPGTRIVLKSSAQQTGCGVLPSGTTRCTGSRRLQRAADLIGDFSGNGILESVRVQGGPISCVVSDSTTCRLEPELAELAGSTEWAAVQMRPNGTTAIFAIVGTTLRICARSSPGGRFVCAAREAAPELTQFSAWVVRKFQRGIFFDGIAFVPAMSSLRPTLPGLADEANALARSLYDAVTPSQHKEIFVNLVDGSSFPYGPSFEDFWEENCPGCGSHVYEWSDMWGFYWFDFRSATSIPNPTACLACDTDRANAYVYCSVAAAVLGGACFGAGTLFALSTGPVGLAGAGIILGATGLCLSGAEFLCLSVADQRLGNCRATSC